MFVLYWFVGICLFDIGLFIWFYCMISVCFKFLLFVHLFVLSIWYLFC